MQQTFSCPKCGSQNHVGQDFCLTCGEVLQWHCPNCENIVDPASRFCPNCGTALGWGLRLREVKLQLAQTEDELRGIITQCSKDVQSQHTLLNEATQRISKLAATESKTTTFRKLNRSGLGIMVLGLGIIGLSYTLTEIPYLAIIGITVLVIGLILQLISNFI